MHLLFLSADNDAPWIGIFLFFSPILLGIGYGIYISARYYYWYNIKPIDHHSKSILEKYYPYYYNLPGSLKGMFERRVILFIRAKDFYGQEGLEVTHEMKVLIAASAVQITFGFKFFQLPRFTKIFIYPHSYYSRHTKKRHKGEVFPLGKIIKLSWDNFLKGFGDPTDGINLGFHEMTHAMSLENKFHSNGVSSFINAKAYRIWKQLAKHEMDLIKSEQSTFFRKYAATNLEEFLAVSVEVFFEQTNSFYEYNPQLYKATCLLLNQDPLPNKLAKE